MYYQSKNNTLQNTWNGTVSLDGKGAGYQLIYTNVPKDSCITMAQNVNLDRRIGLQINTTSGTTGITNGPMTRADATSKCNKSYNTLKWLSDVSKG